MIKKLMFAGLMMVALSSPGQAETNFRGNVVFTAVKNCGDSASVGEEFRSHYHVPMAGNGNFSALSLVYKYGAIGHKVDNAKFTNTYKATKTGGVGWGDAYTPPKTAFILISSQQPATLTPTTPSVIITGKFKNQWGDTGSENCEVTFRGVYVRRLN